MYEAIDVRLRREVAIKVLRPTSPFALIGARDSCVRRRTAAQLSHPNIIPIYSVDERRELCIS